MEWLKITLYKIMLWVIQDTVVQIVTFEITLSMQTQHLNTCFDSIDITYVGFIMIQDILFNLL